ncbi:MAG: hypothetical protein P8X63_08830 [Desulfuromonadaceae bacterium]
MEVVFDEIILDLTLKGVPAELLFLAFFTLITIFIVEGLLNYINHNKVNAKVLEVRNAIMRFVATIIGLVVSFSLSRYLVWLGYVLWLEHDLVAVAVLSQILGGLMCGVLQPPTNKPWLISSIFSPGMYFTLYLSWAIFSNDPYFIFKLGVFVVLVGTVVSIIMCRIGIFVRLAIHSAKNFLTRKLVKESRGGIG